MGIYDQAAQAFRAHKDEAIAAFGLYRSYCGGTTLPRVPGMDTYDRLALRIANGKTVEQAAACEYAYRWHLAIRAPDQFRWDRPARNEACTVFGTPHTIGM